MMSLFSDPAVSLKAMASSFPSQRLAWSWTRCQSHTKIDTSLKTKPGCTGPSPVPLRSPPPSAKLTEPPWVQIDFTGNIFLPRNQGGGMTCKKSWHLNIIPTPSSYLTADKKRMLLWPLKYEIWHTDSVRGFFFFFFKSVCWLLQGWDSKSHFADLSPGLNLSCNSKLLAISSAIWCLLMQTIPTEKLSHFQEASRNKPLGKQIGYAFLTQKYPLHIKGAYHQGNHLLSEHLVKCKKKRRPWILLPTFYFHRYCTVVCASDHLKN